MKKLIITLATLASSLALVAQTKVVENPETDAVYRLPLENGSKVVATTLTPLELGLARSLNTVGFCAWELTTSTENDVVAPRAGVVEEVTESKVIIIHEDGIYSILSRLGSVCVEQGASVKRGDKVGTTSLSKITNKWRVWIEVLHLRSNPNYGELALSGTHENLKQYINPIFTTKQKCKVQLTDGGSYTVKARTWCWPWE